MLEMIYGVPSNNSIESISTNKLNERTPEGLDNANLKK